jgi:hypothetical protein
MVDSRLIHNFDTLMIQLEDEKIPFHRVEKDSTLCIPIQLSDKEGNLFICWEPMHGVVQFIQEIPLVVPEEKRKIIAILLNDINYVLPVLGFYLSKKKDVIVYRTQAFLDANRSISPGLIGIIIGIMIHTAEKFLPQLQKALTPEPENGFKSLFDLK